MFIDLISFLQALYPCILRLEFTFREVWSGKSIVGLKVGLAVICAGIQIAETKTPHLIRRGQSEANLDILRPFRKHELSKVVWQSFIFAMNYFSF